MDAGTDYVGPAGLPEGWPPLEETAETRQHSRDFGERYALIVQDERTDSQQERLDELTVALGQDEFPGKHLPAGTTLAMLFAVTPTTASVPPSRNRGPRSRRAGRRARARAPTRDDDPEPEPPGLTPGERRAHLHRLIDEAVRAIVAAQQSWKACRLCEREKEPEEFGHGSSYCRTCCAELARNRRRQSVPA